jgi:hypothetical protein
MSQAILKHDYHGENTLEGVSKNKIWKNQNQDCLNQRKSFGSC